MNYSAYARGAGVCLVNGTVRNCLIYANTNSHTSCYYGSDNAAGAYIAGGRFYHNTVVGNYLVGDDSGRSGIRLAKGTPDVRNNIIAFNGRTGTEGGVDMAVGTFVGNIVDSDVTHSGASGNRKTDPLFIDPENFDLRVQATSPAVDFCEQAGAIVDDYRGRSRPLGNGYDAGAYEYEPGEFGLVYSIDASTSKIKMGSSLPVTMLVEGVAAGDTVVCKWFRDDETMSGEPVAEGLTYEWTEVAAGGHKITAALYLNGSSTPTGVKTFEFDSLPLEVYVAADGDNVKPYDTPQKAARTFDDAWNGVWKESGATTIVHVAAGSYTNTATTVMDTSVRIIGAGADRVKFFGPYTAEILKPLFQIANDDVEMSGVTVLACTNLLSGKALSMSAGFVHDCTFERNSPPRKGEFNTGGYGGAINMTGGHVSNCVFTANCAEVGGAISMSDGLVEDCVFTANDLAASHNSHGGAAVYLTGGTLRRSTATGNTVSAGYYQNASGGAVCVNGSNAAVENCLVEGNLAKTYGTENTKFYRCAGVCLKNGLVSNCEIRYNTNTLEKTSLDGDPTGAGVQVNGGRFYHNTVVGNYVLNDNGCRSGVYVTGNGDVRNNIFAFNGKTGAEGGCSVSTGTFADNIIDNELAYGSNNRKFDPLFRDLAAGDFRLNAISPAVDLCEDVGVEVDARGVVRPQGGKYDAGAYEYVPGEFGLTYDITAATKSLKSGENIEFTMTVDGLSATDTVVCKWFLDDEEMQGVPVGEGFTYIWTAPSAGTHKATAAFFVNGAADPEGSDTFEFDVLPFEVYVAADGGNVKPYDTPEKAARVFDDAWNGLWKDEAVTSVIHVAAGAYTNVTGYTLRTPMKIVGAGAETVTFYGSKDLDTFNIPMFKVTTNEVELSGFAVAGCNNSANGKAVWMSGGVVRDCRFERNVGGGNGGAVHQEGGLVTNCVFSGNAATAGGGLWMSAGEAVDCTFSGNVCRYSYNSLAGAAAVVSGGTLRRSRIVGNQVSCGLYNGFSGGAVMLSGADALVENCVIEKNFTKDLNESVAYFRAAGVCMSAGVLRNCLISSNTNGIAWRNDQYMTYLNGAGLVMTGGSAYNNTIVGNVLGTGSITGWTANGAPTDADKLRAGVYIVSGMPVVKNNIIAYSESQVKDSGSLPGGVYAPSGIFVRNVTDNDTGITDNLFVTVPPFKNAGRGNYHLKSSATDFIDAGDVSVWNGAADPVDLDGNPRILYNGVDLGCYERRTKGFMLIIR